MGTSDISGIGKVFAQGSNASVKNDGKTEDLKVVFSEVMSQMQTSIGNKMPSDMQQIDAGSATKENYKQYGNREFKIQETSGMKNEKRDQITEKLNEFAERVKEELKEELGVSEEQLEEAMAALGLSYSDLMNPNQLAALVAKLTGAEDMGALLCSEEFMNILHTVGELGEELLQELGISADELAQMLTEADNVVKVDEHGQNETAATVNADEAAMSEEELGTDKQMLVNEQEVDADAETQTSLESVEEASQEKESGSEKNSAFLGQQTSGHSGTQIQNDMAGAVNQKFSDVNFMQPQEIAGATTPQVDISNIIKQIVEFSRVTIGQNATKMEMQLTPENLGKIFMEITAKDGVVSAHITAQNDVVKEALESQLVEFRQNMNQAGIKVDAVEVTVGSHEFEKNLEQNAKQEQQQAEEQEKAATQTRRINLNDLEELSGIMTEEESLVAQIMADHGNSIDFTA